MTRLALAPLLAACAATATPAATPHTVDQATVPLHVEGNRPYIDLAFKKPDGSTRTARFLVDSGGGGFLLTQPLASDLGLALGPTSTEEGHAMANVVGPVAAFVADLPLALDPERTIVLTDETNIVPRGAPGHADGMFPGHLLARYHVVFDYPKATFTIARPGVLAPRGTAVPMPVGKAFGFPRTELSVDGVTHGFLIDTGASFTMVSEVVLKAWGAAHSDWPRHPGAYGEAATLGGTTLETMSLPHADWAGNALTDVGVTSQREGVFEKRMSSLMAAPIVGALAGNVLKQFRVELDYANQTLYLSGPVP
jgi:predicted aspartyl protease